MPAALSLAEIQAIRPLSPDELQVLAHENTAVLDDDFFQGSFITLAGNAQDTVVVSFTLPGTMLGILRQVAMQAPSPAQLDKIVWRIRFNGQAIHGYDRIRGPVSIGILPLNFDKAMYAGWTVDVVASNNDPADIPGVFALVRGNMFNRTSRGSG